MRLWPTIVIIIACRFQVIYECAASLTANPARNGYRVAQGYTRKLWMRGLHHPVSNGYRLYWKKLEIRTHSSAIFSPPYSLLLI